ncbi:37000_t:CDS:2, partial [Racocetra persica]
DKKMEKFVFKTLSSDFSIPSIPSISKISLKRLGVSKPTPPPRKPVAPKTFPPDLLLRILKYLPIASLTNFARACRRFKILVYDDELWEQHLKTLGVNKIYDNVMDISIDDLFINTQNEIRGKSNKKNNSPTSSPVNKRNSFTDQSLEFDTTITESQKKLNLVPGLSLNPLLRKSRTASTGVAREIFKKIYIALLPYYIDFRTKRKDSRLFKEYTDPSNQAKMLARLTNFGKLNVTYDSDEINSNLETIVEYFENSALHHFELAYDAHNLNEMKKWAAMLLNLNGGITCIQHLIEVSTLILKIKSKFRSIRQIPALSNEELNFAPMSEFFSYVEDELKKQAPLIDKIFPPDTGVFHNFVERVFEDLITDYISQVLEEARNRDIILYLKTVVAAYNRCTHVAEVLWKEVEPSMDKINAENMMHHMFEIFMNEYLRTEFATVKSQCDEQIEKWNQKLIEKTSERQQTILINSNREIYKRDYLTYFRKILMLPAPRSRSSTSSMSSQMSYHFDRRGSTASSHSTKSLNSTSNTSDLQAALLNIKFDELQQLLSLEMTLHMIHANKNALHRISVFLGYPDKMGYKVKDILEGIFIVFLRILGLKHIKSGFDTATQHLGEYKPNSDSTSNGLAPLVEFFELIHIADLIQQMVQVYYEEEM